jgi:hypothetical protein
MCYAFGLPHSNAVQQPQAKTGYKQELDQVTAFLGSFTGRHMTILNGTDVV